MPDVSITTISGYCHMGILQRELQVLFLETNTISKLIKGVDADLGCLYQDGMQYNISIQGQTT